MRERAKTFQTRARKVKDDGDDFEDFVFECFRVAKEERGFAKRLARGRDGAIDLVDRFGELGAATVAECKYIGSGKADDAPGRWREVYANLNNNLPGLCSAPDKRLKSPYRAWLDPERPITRYRFCVTAAMSDAEIKALEKRIAGDFAKLVAAGVPHLRVLAEEAGAVRVLPWDWFHAELEEHPSLSFRWFRGLPTGVELFAAQVGEEATFRDFLNSGQLRYFSRDEYARDGIGRVDRGEAELIAHLTGEDGAALLITGPGGVGKTRLSWELAEELSKPRYGFDVYRLGRSAGFASITDMAAHYPGPASILLLVDYAEAAPRLAEIADAIAHVTSNSGHRLRLVATCRASAINQVKDAVSVLPFEEKSLGSTRTGEDDYVQWVTQSILALEPLPEPTEIERVCRGVPALAAFAVFLFRRHRRQFDAQFGALHGLDDFENWAIHRIAALSVRFGGDVSIGRTLARVALALPLQTDTFEAIEAESPLNRSLLRALVDDCWIEREGDCYFAAHDVLADALAARWVFEADHAATERAIDLLQDAARQDRLAGALVALDRLALHPKLVEIDGAAVANQLLARHSEQALQCCGTFLGGSLLSFEEKLDLLHRSEAVRETLNDPVYDVGLSFLAAEAVRRKLSVPELPTLSTLIDLLDRASEHAQLSNMVLRRAYALNPERFRSRAFANIGAYPGAEPTHFLLVQMLRSGESTESLRDALRLWLISNAKAPRASFVYPAWLKAKGPIEAVSESMLTWIEAHGQVVEAQFVYLAWLNAKGPIEAVSESLLAWVDVHGQMPDAQFVYTAWLNAKGPIEAVSESLLAWVDVHGKMPEARFVYNAWLNAKGPIEAVSESLLAWVDVHGKMLEASFVYTAWLNAKGPIEAVSESLLAWVDVHGKMPEASFVYTAWLNAKGPIEAVSESLLAWVDVHGQTPEAQFVYTAWLNDKGPFEAVSESLLAWIEAHGQTFGAGFVYAAWLNAYGPIAPLVEPVYRWVLKWHQMEEFNYLSRPLSKRHDLPEGIVLAIAQWCAIFPNNEDCLFRLSTLLGHVHEGRLSTAGAILVVRHVEVVLEARVSGNLNAVERVQCWLICAALLRGPFFDLAPFGVIRAIASVVASGLVFDEQLEQGELYALHGTPLQIGHFVSLGFRWGMLTVERDHEALWRFTRWLRVMRVDQDIIERITEKLGGDFQKK